MDNKDPGPIPDRWLHCPRKANELIATKFLAFKTPLSCKYDDKVPEESRFPPKMLFMAMKSYKVKLGLWIDLTNTSRFYNKTEIEDQDCKYLKLQCRGHGETPSEDQTKMFQQVVSTFIRNNPLEAIGIHCTHGFNRTGFLIVSYMVEHMDCSLDAALREFARVRPPGIYKEDYILELYRRLDSVEDATPPPSLPSWYTESDDGDPDEANDFAARSKGNKRKEFVNKNPTFTPGISGVIHYTVQPRLSEIQKKIQQMCCWKKTGFPGSQPVSMDNKNISYLKEKPYRVSWKADGTRYLMLIDKAKEIFLFDRDNCAFQVSGLTFPQRKDPTQHLMDTLIDGEMVIDKVNGESIPRYLCYDIIALNGQDVSKLFFYPDRLQCIEKEIVGPRHQGFMAGRIKRAREPFSIRPKQFWDLTQASCLLGEKFAKSLCHEPDGLIFQPSSEPYVAGRCLEVLKWKPLSMNSVDFKLKITTEGGPGILPRKIGELYVGQCTRPFGHMKMNKSIKELDNKIIECKLENNQWVFMRERTDKSFPNSFDTATAVCNSITDPVTQRKLLDFIGHERYHDDSDIMPPPKRQKV